MPLIPVISSLAPPRRGGEPAVLAGNGAVGVYGNGPTFLLVRLGRPFCFIFNYFCIHGLASRLWGFSPRGLFEPNSSYEIPKIRRVRAQGPPRRPRPAGPPLAQLRTPGCGQALPPGARHSTLLRSEYSGPGAGGVVCPRSDPPRARTAAPTICRTEPAGERKPPPVTLPGVVLIRGRRGL